jgi:hypothetical protein
MNRRRWCSDEQWYLYHSRRSIVGEARLVENTAGPIGQKKQETPRNRGYNIGTCPYSDRKATTFDLEV